MENARISDDLDFAVISGWESTAIENHSGIVDNLRNFKSDPELIAARCCPSAPSPNSAPSAWPRQTRHLRPLPRQRHGKPATGELVFSVITPKGKRTELFRCPAPEQTPDQFSYLIAERRQVASRNSTKPSPTSMKVATRSNLRSALILQRHKHALSG
jgi:beta-galactosidase